MNKLYILHNNRCGKSRDAIKLLEAHQFEFEIVHYLDGVLSADDIAKLLNKLNMKAEDIVRKKESLFIENFKGKVFSENEWITILVENPKLIERPIIYNEAHAVVARPLEKLKIFIKNIN